MSDKDYLIKGEMYQYNLGWLIKELMSFKQDLATAIDLKTIKYADPIQWDITTQYPANTVVVDPKSGTAYMSKVPVPTGVELKNTNYWVVVFNYQAIYNKIMDGVAFNDRDQDYATKDLLVNDLVWYAGDLYRVTRAIPTGSKYIPGTNLIKTTIESLLARYYGRDRTAQVSNDTVNVSGDYTLIAGDIAETSTNRTEKIIKDREVDVDGSDSIHIDGASTVNVGGLRSEAYAGNKTETVTGSYTGVFGNASVTTSGKNLVISFPGKKTNLAVVTANVRDYGAIGDGIADDAQAFKDAVAATSDGDVIIVPAGKYKLSVNPYPVSDHTSSVNPADYLGFRQWVIASGTEFTGAGIGSPTTGAGTFASPFSTNPWLTVSGDNKLYNLNLVDRSYAQRGALIGNSIELAPIDTSNTANLDHVWYTIEYRGASTGNAKNTKCNVELLNQVLNITGCTGIATEIDVNNYSDDTGGFNLGLFLTGNGAGKSSMTAIDIQRDADSTKWVAGVSVRMADTALFAGETARYGLAKNEIVDANDAAVTGKIVTNGDGIVLKADTNHTGAFIRFIDTDNSNLVRIDTNGFAFANGYNLNNGTQLKKPITQVYMAPSKAYANEEVSIPITIPEGYKYGICAEVAPIGFTAPVWVTSHSNTDVKVFVAGSGTGSIKISVMFV